jgi:hypothetical protein
MAEIMIAVARAAADLRRFVFENRDYRMVHDPLALHAKVVDIVTQSGRAHHNLPFITPVWTAMPAPIQAEWRSATVQ